MVGEITGAIGPLVQFIGKKLWDPLKTKIDLIEQYSKNVNAIHNDFVNLCNRLKDVKTSLDKGQEEEDVVETNDSHEWRNQVENLQSDKKLKEVIDFACVGDDQQPECFGRGFCHCRGPNSLYNRYNRSKLAVELRKTVQSLLEKVPDQVTQRLPNARAKDRITQYMSSGLKSREDIMNKIVDKLLHDDHVSVVGLYGTASVGKTKMARDLMKQKRVEDVFGNHMALVEVSKTPNKKDIQDKIVEVIDEQLMALDHVALRAIYLYIRFHSFQYEDEKILIILDNMWGKLELTGLGIYPSKNCKVLVISRTKDVCEAMCVEEKDMYELKALERDEARFLFWTQVYGDKEKMVDQVTSWEYVRIGDMLIKDYCQGLPLAIIALAKELRDQNLFQWKSFMDRLATRKLEVLQSIVEDNIRLLEDNKEKKMFFLLTLLFPQNSSVKIQDLVRYAMGLDLIENVDNLSEAITQAQTWARQLISSSLLEADESSTDSDHLLKVSLPHLVRDRAVSLLANENQKFLMTSFPRWHTEETCKKYTSISLMPKCNHSRLDGLYSNKLQVLILDHSQPRENFSDDFFSGMRKLKVLVLKGMKMQPQVPHSIKILLGEGLRLLSLEDCELGDLGTFKSIAGHVKLVVLSFHGTVMEEFPVELLEKCHDLRLLDLSKCTIKKRIPAGVIEKLPQLEGLYAFDSFKNWAIESHDETDGATKGSDSSACHAIAGISELNHLDYLNVLEISVQEPQQLSILNEHLVRKVNQFYIHVGSQDHETSASKIETKLCRILHFRSFGESLITNNNCLRKFMKKTEMFKVDKMEELQQFIHDPDLDDFTYLQHLEINECHKMQCFSFTTFKALNLVKLIVTSCDNLNCFFKELKGDQIKFHSLKLMVLDNLPKLKSMLPESNSSTTGDELQLQQHQHQAFFHEKIIFPSLEELDMKDLLEIVKLWDARCKEPDYISSLKYMKKISIRRCHKLEALAPVSIAVALEQLQELTISECQEIREIIAKEEIEDEEAQQGSFTIFPSLERVHLEGCPKLKVFLSENGNKGIELQTLQALEIKACPEMMSLSSGPFNAPESCQVTIDDFIIQESEHINSESKNINSILRNRFQNLQKPSEDAEKSKGEESQASKSEIQKAAN